MGRADDATGRRLIWSKRLKKAAFSAQKGAKSAGLDYQSVNRNKL
jgi:hypothetical protein